VNKIYYSRINDPNEFPKIHVININKEKTMVNVYAIAELVFHVVLVCWAIKHW